MGINVIENNTRELITEILSVLTRKQKILFSVIFFDCLLIKLNENNNPDLARQFSTLGVITSLLFFVKTIEEMKKYNDRRNSN